MKKFKHTILSSAVLFSVFGLAQDTLSISKNDISKKIASTNLQVKIAEKNAQSAKADYNQAKAVFLPNISVSHTGISTTNPLMAFVAKLNLKIEVSVNNSPFSLKKMDDSDEWRKNAEISYTIN
jgi:hypothetical protein